MHFNTESTLYLFIIIIDVFNFVVNNLIKYYRWNSSPFWSMYSISRLLLGSYWPVGNLIVRRNCTTEIACITSKSFLSVSGFDANRTVKLIASSRLSMRLLSLAGAVSSNHRSYSPWFSPIYEN